MFTALNDRIKPEATLPLNGELKNLPIHELSVIRADLHDYGINRPGPLEPNPLR
jgi:hypothetical protein